MLISIIIPVYNAGKYLRESVESALAQPETAEVILVEDGSPDNSLELCRELVDEFEKVFLYTHPDNANLGASASRNLGISKAVSEFIAFLDADDYYLENRFKAAVEVIKKNPSADGVYEAIEARFETPEEEAQWRSKRSSVLTTMTKRVRPEKLFEYLVFFTAGYFHGDGLVVRKNLFDKCGLFNTSLRISQDTHLWFKMAAVGRLLPGSIDSAVAVRRVHQGNRITKVTNEDSFIIRKNIWTSLNQWSLSAKISRKHSALISYMNYFYDYCEKHGFAAERLSIFDQMKVVIAFAISKSLTQSYRVIGTMIKLYLSK
ncbi:MAG: glycosyltransferase family 2 protein [Candidatus Kapabacteria bacterium]|jgi:glycosyltransferase involved in cell wall biosynthesis|nr:glycosyltransferase family 2 protein [Candidatus Kapabacteria bacterium]